MAQALERVVRGECRRLVICAPPRHGKSELTSRRLPAFYLGHYPGRQLIFTAYGTEFAEEFGRETREIVSGAEYRALFPGVEIAADARAKGEWQTTYGGKYYAVGANGSITGRGAHLAIIDDPVKNRLEADSETYSKRLWEWYKSTLRTRLMPNGSIVITLTRWNENDLAGRLLEEAKIGGEQWELLILPAIENEGMPHESALWPQWYDLSELKAVRGALGRRDWQAMYQQSPVSDEGLQFKRDHIQHYDALPGNLNIYITSDLAVTEAEQESGDYSEIAAWGVDSDDRIYVLDWWYKRADTSESVGMLVDFFDRWRPLRYVGEAGVIERAIGPFLKAEMRRRRVFAVCETLPSIVDKVARASAFAALWDNKRVYWPRTEWAERVIDQLLRFPAGKFDDAVDACSLFGRFIGEVWAAAPSPPPKPTLEEAWGAPISIGQFKSRNRPQVR